MNTYTAEFSNGMDLSRKTKNTYTHAWALLSAKGGTYSSGFSSSAAAAQKAAASTRGFFTNKMHVDPNNIVIEIVEVAA
jgi:hypothetical protein